MVNDLDFQTVLKERNLKFGAMPGARLQECVNGTTVFLVQS
jgi:hypothetical protein